MLARKGYALKDIGNALGRPKSVIWYELRKRRNGRRYDPAYAAQLTYVRRKYGRATGKKIALHRILRDFVEHHLMDDQSPEGISGRLRCVERHTPYASPSVIRRYVRTPYGRRIEAHRRRVFRKRRKRKGENPRITNKRMITKRPVSINKRWGLGHFEGDFIASGKSGKGLLLVLVDRKIRKKLLEKICPVSVRAVERGLRRMKRRYPEMQTLTFDNDLLLLEHKRMEHTLGITIYFCHTHAPWEKGSVENVNKMIRRYIPKGSDLSQYSRRFIRRLEEKLNRRFMKVLGYHTPDEAYARAQGKKRTKNAREA